MGGGVFNFQDHSDAGAMDAELWLNKALKIDKNAKAEGSSATAGFITRIKSMGETQQQSL
jgi:hypothetical protein